MERGVLNALWFLALLAIVGGLIAVLILTGLPVMLGIGWAVSTLFLLLWFGSLMDLFSKTLGRVFLGIAILCIILTLLGARGIVQEALPFCGDDVCAVGECEDECPDCTAADCLDGACQLGIEDCRTPDCACLPDLACAPGRGATNERGCAYIECGDGYCDAPEDQTSCCQDCGCARAYECIENLCYFETPAPTFVPYMYTDAISATSLAANPSLVDVHGRDHPFMAFNLTGSVSDALNVKMTFSVGGMARRMMDLGTLHAGQQKNVMWYLDHEPDLLKVTEDNDLGVVLTMTFDDLQNVSHEQQWLFPFTVRSRNVLDEHGHIAFFVTPDDYPFSAESPSAVWRTVQEVTVGEPTGTVQFPAETLDKGVGSPRDIALVLASGFLKGGFRTSLVESDAGMFVRVWDGRKYAILDPEKLALSYSQAEADTPGFAVHEIEQVWREKNATVLSLTS